MTELAACTLAFTRACLARWGRWAFDASGGYPTAAAYVARARGAQIVPEGVLAVDQVIARLPAEGEAHLQRRLLDHYLRSRPLSELIEQTGITRRTYFRRLEEAQYAVHVRL